MGFVLFGLFREDFAIPVLPREISRWLSCRIRNLTNSQDTAIRELQITKEAATVAIDIWALSPRLRLELSRWCGGRCRARIFTIEQLG
jgi:hypothetical protein